MESLKNWRRDIILRAERIFKTDINYLLRGASWLGLNQVGTSFIAFILSLIFANLLSPAVYGLYKYVLSIAAILAIPTLSGIDSAVTQAVARKFEGTMLVGMKTKLRWGIGTTILGIGVGLYYIFIGHNMSLAISFIFIGVFIPLSEAFDIYNSLLSGRARYNTYTIYNLSTQIFLAVGLALTIFTTSNLIILVAAYCLLNTIINLFFLILTLRRQKPNTNVDPTSMNYGKHLSLVSVINVILDQMDKILIFHFLGATDLAIYTVAVAPTEQIKGVLKNIQFLALPRFAARSKEDVRSTIFHKAFYFGLIVTCMVIAYIFIAPYAFKIFFPKYPASVFYSQLLSISLVGVSVGTFLYIFLESQAAKKQIYQYNIITTSIGVIILLPLIYYYGLLGAIIARIISRYVLLATSTTLVKNF